MIGADAITVERYRQQTEKGYTFEHDADHDPIEFVWAAQAYLRAVEHRMRGVPLSKEDAAMLTSDNGFWTQKLWPWDIEGFKPTGDDYRDLVKAGALVAAAIDRVMQDAE